MKMAKKRASEEIPKALEEVSGCVGFLHLTMEKKQPVKPKELDLIIDKFRNAADILEGLKNG